MSRRTRRWRRSSCSGPSSAAPQQAEAFLQVGRQADVRVRDGEIEDLTQATSKGVGLRVFVKQRLGFAWTSDFDPSTLDAFVDRAIALAEASAPNPLNGLPDKADLGRWPDVGALFDDAVASLPPDWKINASLEMEKVVPAFDPRIKTIESVGAGEVVSEVYLASSAGVHGSYRGTSVYLYAAPVATDGDQLQTSYWYDAKRFLGDLESPEAVAQGGGAAGGAAAGREEGEVAEGARGVRPDRWPRASSAPSPRRPTATRSTRSRPSWPPQKGKRRRARPPCPSSTTGSVAARAWAPAPSTARAWPRGDGHRRARACSRSFLYDAFTARKAKTKTTGNASRGYRSLPSIGTNNLYLEPGTRSPEEIIGELPNGFYVTAMLGHGANLVTGEYSRGANGLWIENGELTRPGAGGDRGRQPRRDAARASTPSGTI